MSLNVTTRLTLWYFVVFGSAVILMAVARHLLFAWGEEEHLDTQGKTYTNILLAHSPTWQAPLPLLVASLDSLNTKSELQYRCLRVFLDDGTQVLYDNAAHQGTAPLLDSIRRRIGGRQGFHTLEIDSKSYRTYTASPQGEYADNLLLTVVIPREELDGTLRRLSIFITVGVVLALGIAWIGGLRLTRHPLAIVEQMRQTATEITGTNLARRVPVGNKQDALSALGRTFNDMIERLQRYSNSYQVFVTNTFHDLRTPLTVIRAELQLARAEENSSPEFVEMVRRCESQLDRLDRLTGDLLFFAKLDTDGMQLRPRNVDLEELIVDCAASMQGLIQKKKMFLDIELPEEASVSCTCDDHLLRRAIVNLLDNAINYSPEESTIRISLQTKETEAWITVADNGPGMGEEELHRVTERLYRGAASRGSGGSGLGLAIAREIMEAHEGKLIIDSTLGKGTSVTLVLPL